MPSLLTWYYTLRPLKARQCVWLFWRPLAMAFARRHRTVRDDIESAWQHGANALLPLDAAHCFQPEKRRFSFLNTTHCFPEKIDWDSLEHGLLWAYHLNYFDWLYDDSLSPEARLETMRAFASAASTRVGNDAYPSSLRIVAWTRFLLRFGQKDEAVLSRLFRDADWLCRFPEFQLDGNHLFENALALVCAGAFFQNERFYGKGCRLLRSAAQEQILPDGGHIEGSPMYHSLLLWRSLQCLELLRALPFQKEDLAEWLAETAARMLGWMQAMTFSDGSWPMFNDAAQGLAPTTAALDTYAAELGVAPLRIELRESGYRMLRAGDLEIAIDAAPIQPAFQPGHAHADFGTFCLHFKGRAVIVDMGVSTYEAGGRRNNERGTAAHNTVALGGRNSSEVWKSFRVGRRSRLIALREEAGMLDLIQKPFSFPGCEHRRRFSWSESALRIEDEVTGNCPAEHIAFLHFHPSVSLMRLGENSFTANGLEVRCSEAVRLEACELAEGFNRLRASTLAGILFTSRLIIEIDGTHC